jgi:hypothetical protein
MRTLKKMEARLKELEGEMKIREAEIKVLYDALREDKLWLLSMTHQKICSVPVEKVVASLLEHLGLTLTETKIIPPKIIITKKVKNG